MKKHLHTLLLGLGLITALAALPLSAQTPPAGGNGGAADNGGGNNGGGRGNRGNRGNFDPAAMMQQLKTDLGATDDEWKVLEPKITKINDLRRAEFAGRFGGRGRGGPGGDNNTANATPESPVAKAAADLRATLDNKDSTPDQIKAKLQALRDARTKAKEDMTKAQSELKELITVKQEAILVSRGMLE